MAQQSSATYWVIARSKRDGTRVETRFGLSAKLTSPFKSAGASVQSTIGNRGVRISGQQLFNPCSVVQYETTHSIRIVVLHFHSRASPCASFRTRHNTYFDYHAPQWHIICGLQTTCRGLVYALWKEQPLRGKQRWNPKDLQDTCNKRMLT